jgi:hypothetical protein
LHRACYAISSIADKEYVPGQVINSHKQFVVLIAGLLLIAGQLASLVHAADHPFHAPDEICAAFASFEHNNHVLIAASPGIEAPYFTDRTNTRLTCLFINRVSSCRQARAPPLHT